MVKADSELKEKWVGINCLVLVISSRKVKKKESVEYRYYVSSSNLKVDEIALAIRKHWSIESAPQALKETEYKLKLCA